MQFIFKLHVGHAICIIAILRHALCKMDMQSEKKLHVQHAIYPECMLNMQLWIIKFLTWGLRSWHGGVVSCGHAYYFRTCNLIVYFFLFFGSLWQFFFTHLHHYLTVLHTNPDKIKKKPSHTCMGFDLGTSRSQCRGLNQCTTGVQIL